MTKKEVFKILVLIESVYTYCLPKDETVENWFLHCSGMDYEKVIMRLKMHLRVSPYPPCMAELQDGIDLKLPYLWLSEYIPRKRVDYI